MLVDNDDDDNDDDDDDDYHDDNSTYRMSSRAPLRLDCSLQVPYNYNLYYYNLYSLQVPPQTNNQQVP